MPRPDARPRERSRTLQPVGAWDGASLLDFVGLRAIDGVEGLAPDGSLGRVLVIDGEPVLVGIALSPTTATSSPSSPTPTPSPSDGDPVRIALTVVDEGAGDAASIDEQVLRRVSHVLDLGRDGDVIDDAFRADPVLGSSVAARPGHRSPGSFDAEEIVARAILGQQVSVERARTLLGDLAAHHGVPLPRSLADHRIAKAAGLTRAFPSPASIARIDPDGLPMPRSRAAALITVSQLLAERAIDLHHRADAREIRKRLLEVRGIGPWTADYVLLRGLGDPDLFLPSDLGIRRSLRTLGLDGTPVQIEETARRWSPWRSYALHRLWALPRSTVTPPPGPTGEPTSRR